jgi:hypothetical protein
VSWEGRLFSKWDHEFESAFLQRRVRNERRRRTPWCRDRKNEHVWQAAWTEIIQDKATPQAAAEKAFKRVEERWRRIIRDR